MAAALNPRQLTGHLSHARDLSELLTLQQRHGDHFNGFHVGAFWSRFKALARGELGGLRDRLAPVCEQTVRMLPELNARALANVAHAFAKAGMVGTGPWQIVWAALPEAVLRALVGFNAQAISNTAWAFATAGHASPELFEAISIEAMRRQLGGFNEQNLSNTAWAFATASHSAPDLFDAVSAEALHQGLGNFKEQGFSNTAWAFATAGRAAPDLFDAITAGALCRGLGGFEKQHLSNTAWAFAKAGHAAPDLFDAISAEALHRGLGGFNDQNLSNTAWAFATAGHAAPYLFDAISAEALRRGLGGFNAQDLSITAWAFATAGHPAPYLFDAISAEALRQGLGGFKEQELSNTAWAFAVFDPPSADELFSPASFSSRLASLERPFSFETLRQLHQWSLWREERGLRWPGLPDSLQQACRNAFVETEGRPSQLQRDVVRQIRSRGANVKEEHRCQASGYSIDALVTFNDGERFAVEVDGPSHFLRHSQQPTGATLLKHRQLRYFGWRLEIVLYREWEDDTEAAMRKLHWLPQSSSGPP
jgi:hypothetical protein